MDNMTLRECGDWYGDRLKNIVMFADIDTLNLPAIRLHTEKIALLANLFVCLAGSSERSSGGSGQGSRQHRI